MGTSKNESEARTVVSQLIADTPVAIAASEPDSSKELVFTEAQLVALVTSIFNSVNTRIADRIATSVTQNDTNHMPSGDAVHKHVSNAVSSLETSLKQYADTKATEAQSAATKAANAYTDSKTAGGSGGGGGSRNYSVDFTIQASTGWNTDSDPHYPEYYDIEVPGASGEEFMSVILDNPSLVIAGEAGVSSVCDIMAEKCRIRAERRPTANMTGIIRVEP